MKKRVVALLLGILVVLSVSGCGTQKTGIAPTTTPEPTKDPAEIEIEAFFEQYVNGDERPVAVMIDNDDKNARPQVGLEDAYIMYEMPVEGGATRFMALYRGVQTEKIGPVRSSRHYFLDYVMEHDAIYTHFGWSPKAIQDISAFGIEKINGVLGGDGNIFWREEKFRGDWHSAYTSMKNIKEMAEKKGFSLTTDKTSGICYAENYLTLSRENPATAVTLPYSGFYRTGYVYNTQTGLYEQTINDQPHTMQNGTVPAFKNIIIQLIYDTALGDGSDRRDIDTTGSGKGYYITNGAYEEITWSKSSRSGNTVYTKTDGTELLINPGKTAINIISPAAGMTIEPAPVSEQTPEN